MQIFIYCKVTLHVSGVTQHPSSGVLTTVTAASGTGHDTGTATFLQRGLIRPRWRQVAVPIYKYLHTVASGWIFISIEFKTSSLKISGLKYNRVIIKDTCHISV